MKSQEMNEETGITLNYIKAVIKLLNPKENNTLWRNNYLSVFIFQSTEKQILKKPGYG